MSSEFKHGDRVYVIDEGLARLREIMRNATGEEPAPNHTGTVDAVTWDGNEYQPSVLIVFDDTGSAAPYPVSDVRHLDESAGASGG